MRQSQTADFAIGEQKATAMVRYAIDRGVNHLDTAYGYHNGQSEPFLGRALAGRYGVKINLATNLCTMMLAGGKVLGGCQGRFWRGCFGNARIAESARDSLPAAPIRKHLK